MEGSHPERFVPGDSQVMDLPVYFPRKALVAAGLVSDMVSIPAKQAGEFITIDMPGQFHTAISSSFTR